MTRPQPPNRLAEAVLGFCQREFGNTEPLGHQLEVIVPGPTWSEWLELARVQLIAEGEQLHALETVEKAGTK